MEHNVSESTTLKKQLENGLTVLLKSSKKAPVTTVWTWYRVGSRNEKLGHTGAAHWIEHMLSARFLYQGRDLFSVYSRLGGINNAGTSFDYTHYFATLPPDRIDTALQIAAARMRSHRLDPGLVERERTVVISERQWRENEPRQVLFENVLHTAFQIHPYRHEPIGYMCDLQTMDRDDLQRFLDTYYVPNNALLVSVGPSDPESFFKQIEASFADICSGAPISRGTVEEPPQRGERRVEVEGPGGTDYIEVAYRAPGVDHPDFFAMVVLDTVLTGAGSLVVFGGGGSNVSSRLYHALVDTELATDCWGSIYPTVDPFLYAINITVRAGRDLTEVQAALEGELERISAQPVSKVEIAKAIQQAKAVFAYGAESTTNQGFWYGFSEIFADYTWFENFITTLSAVTVEDVQRVAQQLLKRSQRTVGWYVTA